MTRVRINVDVLKMRFESVYSRFINGEITTEEASSLLHFSSRTFLRKRDRYEEEGFDGRFDRRLGRISGQRAADEEVELLTKLYRERYEGYNVRHFHALARRNHGVKRSYSWTKNKRFCRICCVEPELCITLFLKSSFLEQIFMTICFYICAESQKLDTYLSYK